MEELGQAMGENNTMDLEEKGCFGTDWIHLTQEKDQSLALVNMVMDLCVHYKAEIFTC
jgi:hypothetical protein